MEYLSVKRLTFAMITFTFVVYLIPGMWGAPLKGLSGYLPPIRTQDFKLGQVGVNDGGGSAAIKSDSHTIGQEKNSLSGGILSSQGVVPLYSDFLGLPHGIEAFFRYDEGMEYARKVNKPLFIDFTGHGCVNCREMEQRVWVDPRVLKLLKEEFIVIALYADDKKEAVKEDWITTDRGRKLTSIGKINSHLAMKKYNVNAQPYYAIIDPYTEEHLTTPRGYNLDIDIFLEFLQSGLR